MAGRKIFLLTFWINEEHVNSRGRLVPIVDQPDAAPFPLAAHPPSHLAEAAASWDERPLLWSKQQRKLDLSTLLIRKQPLQFLREDWRLNKFHYSTIRQWRTFSNILFILIFH